MEGKFCAGDRIVIKLNSGENYEGDFVRGSSHRLTIDNILHYETGNKLDALYTFYRREIDCVFKLSEKKNETSELSSKKLTKSDNSITIPREEYDRLKEVANNYIYIKFDDNLYFESVNQIANFESIGILGIQNEKGRCGKCTLIAVCTWKQVYIFDIKNFRSRKFPSEIAEILESSYIKKVIHNGGTLVDCLKHSHGIIMENIFDTQVSHLMLWKNASGRCPEDLKNIGECLTEYLNFPPTLLSSSLLSLNESWDERPLDDDQLKKLSRLVTYLLPLKDYQMNLMLRNFNNAVKDYHKLFIQSSEFEMIKRSSTQKCPKDVDDIIPMSLLGFHDEHIEKPQ